MATVTGSTTKFIKVKFLEMQEERLIKERLIVVSNRLPFVVRKNDVNGKLERKSRQVLSTKISFFKDYCQGIQGFKLIWK